MKTTLSVTGAQSYTLPDGKNATLPVKLREYLDSFKEQEMFFPTSFNVPVKEPEVESDEDFSKRLVYVCGKQRVMHAFGTDLDKIGEEYGLKRRVS